MTYGIFYKNAGNVNWSTAYENSRTIADEEFQDLIEAGYDRIELHNLDPGGAIVINRFNSHQIQSAWLDLSNMK